MKKVFSASRERAEVPGERPEAHTIGPLMHPSVLADSGASGVAIAVTVIATLVLVALVVSVAYLLKTSRQLRKAADLLRDSSNDLVRQSRAAVDQASQEVGKVSELVGSAEEMMETVGSASRIATTALATPVIKVMAFGAGTARAARRLRKGGR